VGLKKKYMEDKRILHGQLMNEHRKLANEIADIKANSYELNEEEKRKVAELQRQQMLIMKKLENLLK
jgi:predicted membrane chloride channel (bestrophin family)